MDRSAPALRSALEQLAAQCRAAGLAVTPQRLAVYRALLEAEDHPDSEDLHRRLKRVMPSLSLATVYKALEALRQLGVVQEVTFLSDTRRWDANMERHHHVVCTRCHRVDDIESEELDAIKPPHLPGGFVPREVSVQILGTCAACSARKPS
jgi:Fur family peroxide stress response transcriptional regulator